VLNNDGGFWNASGFWTGCENRLGPLSAFVSASDGVLPGKFKIELEGACVVLVESETLTDPSPAGNEKGRGAGAVKENGCADVAGGRFVESGGLNWNGLVDTAVFLVSDVETLDFAKNNPGACWAFETPFWLWEAALICDVDVAGNENANGLGVVTVVVVGPCVCEAANKDEKVCLDSAGWGAGCAKGPAGLLISRFEELSLVAVCEKPWNTLLEVEADAEDAAKGAKSWVCLLIWILGAGVSFSSSLTKRESSSSAILVTAGCNKPARLGKRELSIIPWLAACLTFNPRMMATSVLPARLDSTYFCEKACREDDWKAVWSVRKCLWTAALS